MALFEIFFVSVLFFSFRPSTSVEICSVSCGMQSIRFPFRLNNQPDRCGYPRFNLSCKNEHQSVLALPFAGDFTVLNIDYISQNIGIADPNHCSAKRLLEGLNLSGTPFDLLNPRSYKFFNCSSAELPAGARLISCLSGGNFSVVAVPEDRVDTSKLSTLTSCSEMATVWVPLWWTGSPDVGDGIWLTWNEPDCQICESKGGSCMFNNDTGLDVGCSGGFGNGIPKRVKFAIMFGAGLPLVLLFSLIIYLRCKFENRYHLYPISGTLPSSSPNYATRGLDGQTIDAYPIILIGESRRLPRPNDNTCPICLSEYQAKETLRTIPDCKHYFHAVCIDEWLKLNAACPLCRNTPEKSIVNADNAS